MTHLAGATYVAAGVLNRAESDEIQQVLRNEDDQIHQASLTESIGRPETRSSRSGVARLSRRVAQRISGGQEARERVVGSATIIRPYIGVSVSYTEEVQTAIDRVVELADAPENLRLSEMSAWFGSVCKFIRDREAQGLGFMLTLPISGTYDELEVIGVEPGDRRL
jgi:hypothetical protein